jgi:hypothetical protein
MALHTVFFGVFEMTRMESPWLLLFFGLVLMTAAEFLRGSRFAGNGSDAAASFWAIAFLLVGFGWLWSETSHDEETTITLILVAAVLLFAAACIRWGFAVYGTFGAVALFGLRPIPAGRLWWSAGPSSAGARLPNLDRAAPRRTAPWPSLAVAPSRSLALNRVRRRALRRGPSAGASPEPGLAHGCWRLSTAATALLPPGLVAWGSDAAQLILDLGLVFAAASSRCATTHLAPPVLLTLARRARSRRPVGEPLPAALGGRRAKANMGSPPIPFGRRTEALQAAAVVAGFTARRPVEARGGTS